MTRISKKKLDSEILERLFIQFSNIVKSAGIKESNVIFIDEFFTKSERIMFAKRLATIILLSKGMPQHIVSEKLNISSSTVAIISRNLKLGKYDGILEIASQSKNRVLGILVEIIVENLPRPFGRSRGGWGSIYRDSPKFSDKKFYK